MRNENIYRDLAALLLLLSFDWSDVSISKCFIISFTVSLSIERMTFVM